MMLCILALAVRAVVPAGLMPARANGQMVLALCSGTANGAIAVAIPLRGSNPAPGDEHDAQHMAHMPCAFAGLAMPGLAAAPPVLLLAAIHFVLRHAWRGLPLLAVPAPARLRPPLRAPPAIA